MLGRGVLIGAAIAAGGLLLVPGVAPAVGRAMRPLVRASVRTGAVAFDEFRKAGAEVYEHIEDVVAEVRTEMAEAAEEAAEAGAGTARASEHTGA